MKTKKTTNLERKIRRATHKTGVFQCFEVTIGFFGNERVDFMTYDTKGIFRCYEIKVSKADFHSGAAKSFVGHYNYYVLTRDLYNQVKDEIPDWVGVYVGESLVKKPKKQDLSGKVYTYRRSVNGYSTELSVPWEEMLKESMIRSLYRDADKYLNTVYGLSCEMTLEEIKEEKEQIKKLLKKYKKKNIEDGFDFE